MIRISRRSILNLVNRIPLNVQLAPYRAEAEYLHDYYTVYVEKMNLLFRETFIQLDPDANTEKFIAYSDKKARHSLKHSFLLGRIMAQRSHKEHIRLSRWGLTDSFLMSPDQFSQLLAPVGLIKGSHNAVFGYGEGGGSVLVNLAKSLQE